MRLDSHSTGSVFSRAQMDIQLGRDPKFRWAAGEVTVEVTVRYI